MRSQPTRAIAKRRANATRYRGVRSPAAPAIVARPEAQSMTNTDNGPTTNGIRKNAIMRTSYRPGDAVSILASADRGNSECFWREGDGMSMKRHGAAISVLVISLTIMGCVSPGEPRQATGNIPRIVQLYISSRQDLRAPDRPSRTLLRYRFNQDYTRAGTANHVSDILLRPQALLGSEPHGQSWAPLRVTAAALEA
jgi:hypothetical protein